MGEHDFTLAVFVLCCGLTTGLSRHQDEITDEWNNSNSTNNTDRIVGGVATDITHHPYQASLEFSNRHLCGASIFNQYWIVTAAHCVHGRGPQSLLQVRAGSSYQEFGGSIHQATNVIMHPAFNSRINDFDVAVVKVSNPFVYGNSVRPISLSYNEPSVGTVVTITGWGSLHESGPNSQVLQRVEVNIIHRKECSRLYSQKGFPVTDRMICAGVAGGGKDHCFGDSGGPVVANGKLVGIVSWAEGCARPFYPGVNSNVAKLRQWITRTTRSK